MTRIIKTLCFIIGLGACALGIFSTAAAVDFTYQGNALWAYMEDAVIDGKHVFCAMHHGLMILDITDPSSPVEVSSYNLFAGIGQSIAVSGKYAYMGLRGGGMLILDISDVTSPQPVSEFPVVNWVSALCVVGTNVFVSDAFQGLRVVDVSDPANPSEINFSPTLIGQSDEISVAQGDYLYLSDDRDLRIIDISVPANPQQVAMYHAPNMIRDFSPADTLGYLAAGDSGLIVLNIADPASPVEIAREQFDGGQVRSIVVHGDLIYSGQGSWQSGYAIGLIDVSDPTQPTASGQVESGGYALHGAPGQLLVTDKYNRYELYDVGTPTEPQFLSASLIPYYGFPGYGQEIVTDGKFVYVAGGDMGLVIVDITDPTSPDVVSQGINPNRCFDLELRDRYIYLADDGDYSTEGLKIVDVSHPAAPEIVGSLRLSSCNKITVDGSYAYLGGNGPTNYIVSISDPANPVQLGTTYIPGITNGFAVNGKYLYISYGFGLVIADISSPSQPVILDTLATENGFGEILMYKGYLLAAVTGGFEIMDVTTDPLTPTSVAFCACPAYDIKPYGDYLFIGNSQGTTLIEMNPPTVPAVVASRPLATGADAVAPYYNGLATYDPEGLTIFSVSMPACCNYPGDANYDLNTNLADVVFLINLIFKDGPPLLCPAAGDANGDCEVNIGDAVYLVDYIFRSGDAPVCASCP